MKLALLIRDLGYAGAQRQAVALARGVAADAEHRVTVVCFYSGPMEAELRAAGVAVVCVGKRHRWDMLGFAWRVLKTLRGLRADVLYSFMAEANLLAAVLKPLLPRSTRLVWGLRDSESDAALYGWLGRLVFALGKSFARCPEVIIANSESGARYYAGLGYPAEKLMVVPNGIDVGRFSGAEGTRDKGQGARGETEEASPTLIPYSLSLVPSTLAHPCPLLGAIGRMSPMKDYATLLRAFALLPLGAARLMIMGGGSAVYLAQMQTLAAELGVAERVTFHEPREDMPAVFGELDALVSSSAFGEGFSNVVGEAMACGTPCIVTEVGDSAWLVGDTGFSAPARDAAGLAAAMGKFFALDAAARAELGRKARARIVAEFTVEKMVARTLHYLHERDARAPLLFIITALGTGGAEMMLTQVILRLDRGRFEPRVISLVDGGKYAEVLTAAGIPVDGLGMLAGRPTLRSLWRLRTLVKGIAPSVIVGWMYHGNLAATLASWFAHRAPVLWNVRQSLYSLALEKRGSALVIRALAWLSRWSPVRILYNSAVSAQQHEAMGYAKAKSLLVPNGFDTTAFAPSEEARTTVRTELGLAGDAALVGRFGRATAMKDYPCFDEAMGQVRKRMVEPVTGIVAGTGTAELPSSLIALGERSDMPRLTAALDVAVSSSAFGEGFPNVIAEAMCSGVPCVVTDVGDSAWLVGEAGKVVPARDAAALAQAIAEMLAMPTAERRALGLRGRQRIVEDFSLPAVVAKFEQIFNEVSTGSKTKDEQEAKNRCVA